MARLHLKGRNIRVHFHPRRPHTVFRTEDSISQTGLKHRKVCPNCGHPEFEVIPNWFSWLLGQRSKCKKCGFIFKRAYTEKEYQKIKGLTRLPVKKRR